MKASIIIPVLNEIKFIEKCINSIINYVENEKDLEILLVDGGSTDGTEELIQEFSEKYNSVNIFKNQKRIQAAAMNIGIENSTSEYIIRLDAHSEYSEHYLKKCIEILDKSSNEIANVGGAIITMPGADTFIAKTISFVLTEKFGVGNSTFRTENVLEEKFVETVPYGCFRRSAIENIGFFDENLERGEDLEFNKRLINFGKKILISPEIKSIYYSRPTFSSFVIQAFRNGFFITNKLSLKNIFHQLRHFIPLFFMFFILSLTISLIWNYSEPINMIDKILLLIALLYFSISSLLGIKITLRNKNIIYLFTTPFMLFSLHMTYGLGSLIGLIYKK